MTVFIFFSFSSSSLFRQKEFLYIAHELLCTVDATMGFSFLPCALRLIDVCELPVQCTVTVIPAITITSRTKLDLVCHCLCHFPHFHHIIAHCVRHSCSHSQTATDVSCCRRTQWCLLFRAKPLLIHNNTVYYSASFFFLPFLSQCAQQFGSYFICCTKKH